MKKSEFLEQIWLFEQQGYGDSSPHLEKPQRELILEKLAYVVGESHVSDPVSVAIRFMVWQRCGTPPAPTAHGFLYQTFLLERAWEAYKEASSKPKPKAEATPSFGLGDGELTP